MKTNFEKQKRNNVQKTALNFTALAISLIIISITVDAQGIWKSFLEIRDSNDSNLIMADNSKNSSSIERDGLFETVSYAMYSELESEEVLELENWMTDESFFAVDNMKTETENVLELEAWMTNDNYFIPSTVQYYTETESPLELEGWMLDEEYFKSVKGKEQPMALENWMIAENYWN